VRVNHKRAGLGLISAVTNKGELRWMVLDGAVKAPSLIRFLARLVRDVGRKVFLILDRLPVTAPPRSALGWPNARPRSRCSTCRRTAPSLRGSAPKPDEGSTVT
jgi:hypothetical protein